MSWTNPKTVIPGDPAIAADWNTYVRNNTSFLYERIQFMTQAEYNAISADPETIYVIVG